MKKKSLNKLGKAITIIGFIGLFFFNEESLLLQLLWTATSIALFWFGSKIIVKTEE